MGKSGVRVRACGIDALQHVGIDGGFIVPDEEFQIARRRNRFGRRKPVHQFVKLLLAHSVSPYANSVIDLGDVDGVWLLYPTFAFLRHVIVRIPLVNRSPTMLTFSYIRYAKV